MKKIMIASAAAALMTVSGAAIAQERVYASTDLNVRSGPGTNYGVVGNIGASQSARVQDCSGRWCRISYAGGEGWVSSSYLIEGEGQRRGGSNAGTTTGVATGVIGGALIGGPIGAVAGGLIGGAAGAGADIAAEDRGGRRGAGTRTGVATGVIGGALVGGPIGAVVGGIAGGAIGAGADGGRDGYVDDVVVGSTVPDRIPLSAIPQVSDPDTAPEFTTMRYGGRTIRVETATGRVVNVMR